MTDHELNCEDVLRQLLDYLDGEMDSEGSAQIEHHLEHCRGCFSRAEFERRLKARIGETGTEEAPESLRARLKSLLNRF